MPMLKTRNISFSSTLPISRITLKIGGICQLPLLITERQDLRNYSWNIVVKSAAGDMDKSFYIKTLEKFQKRFNINSCRFQHFLDRLFYLRPGTLSLTPNFPFSRRTFRAKEKPLLCRPLEASPMILSLMLTVEPLINFSEFHNTHAKTGKIIFTRFIKTGHFGGFTA